MGRLAGKVALVVGAGGGIGAATCRNFLTEGALVVAADLHIDRAQAALGESALSERAVAVRCDVSESESVRDAVSGAVSAFGRLDALCNFAGGSTPQDSAVVDASEEEFWRAIRVDLFGTFLCGKHAIPELIRAGGGSIINTTSIVAMMAVPGKDCYTAAKGGVISLTRSMAVEYAAYGVRVNAIAPGITTTPRVLARPEVVDDADPLVRQHLLGLVDPSDVAHLAVYLASDESRVITGQVLQVDSGATLL